MKFSTVSRKNIAEKYSKIPTKRPARWENASSRISVARGNSVNRVPEDKSPTVRTVVSRKFIHVVRGIENSSRSHKKKKKIDPAVESRFEGLGGLLVVRYKSISVSGEKKEKSNIYVRRKQFRIHCGPSGVKNCSLSGKPHARWMDRRRSRRGLFGETNLLRCGVGGQFVSGKQRVRRVSGLCVCW